MSRSYDIARSGPIVLTPALKRLSPASSGTATVADAYGDSFLSIAANPEVSSRDTRRTPPREAAVIHGKSPTPSILRCPTTSHIAIRRRNPSWPDQPQSRRPLKPARIPIEREGRGEAERIASWSELLAAQASASGLGPLTRVTYRESREERPPAADDRRWTLHGNSVPSARRAQSRPAERGGLIIGVGAATRRRDTTARRLWTNRQRVRWG